MVDTSKCKGCIYWRSITGSKGSDYACHYLLDTEKRRKRDESGCLSRETQIEALKIKLPKELKTLVKEKIRC